MKKFKVDFTDEVTGTTSPIDNIVARDDYTANDYINDCLDNADDDWCNMIQNGTISLVEIKEENNMRNYNESVKVIANSDKTVFDRGDLVVKEMSRLTSDILDYRYAAEHYKGDGISVMGDKARSIKNSIALLESDLDVYKEMLGITDLVKDKKEQRIGKVAEKVKGGGRQ